MLSIVSNDSTNQTSLGEPETNTIFTTTMASAAFVTLGAILGALSRWRIQVQFGALDPQYTKWATLGINVVGSLILGESNWGILYEFT